MGSPTMRVSGLGYEPEYFTVDGHEVVHVAVSHVDPLVRAFAPVWVPQVAPAPLCGLGQGRQQRRVVSLSGGDARLCRPCRDHLRDLNEWVRQAERQLVTVAAGGSAGNEVGVGGLQPVGNRVHHLPF